ncbi:MAG: tRNA guanosine(34) transglycosylase Tgt [Candidatus Tumulicola sp.]
MTDADAARRAFFTLNATDGGARSGTLALTHGVVETPCFMPVGTAATVKGLTPDELRETQAQMILANAYHLALRPGRDVIERAGGLHRFMAWNGPILIDSGGFQVFSLEGRRSLDDDGVTFQSHLDGSERRFTPESVVAFGEAIGADVAMVLAVCVKLPATYEQLEASVRRTTEWARRSVAAHRSASTVLFGIVQGGLDPGLRERSARELVELGLPGYAVGGLSVGETRAEMYAAARACAELLPPEKPRYLMGVGTVRDLIEAVDGGIDMFDCVYPTRCGRNGRAMTRAGHFNVFNAAYVDDFSPVDAQCGCSVCRTYTRAYLAHLFRSDEMLGPRLLSYHNVSLLNRLLIDARRAIAAGGWHDFRDHVLTAAARA